MPGSVHPVDGGVSLDDRLLKDEDGIVSPDLNLL